MSSCMWVCKESKNLNNCKENRIRDLKIGWKGNGQKVSRGNLSENGVIDRSDFV